MTTETEKVQSVKPTVTVGEADNSNGKSEVVQVQAEQPLGKIEQHIQLSLEEVTLQRAYSFFINYKFDKMVCHYFKIQVKEGGSLHPVFESLRLVKVDTITSYIHALTYHHELKDDSIVTINARLAEGLPQ